MYFSALDPNWLLAFGLNALLIVLASRLPLLTSKGWIHAGILGTILWGCLGFRGWISVVLYLILGYLVTRLGFKQKQKAGLAEARGGTRGPENVWGSAATGAFLALLYKATVGLESLILVGFAASFSAKLADTFGSEIGKRWGSRTFLITSLRPVPAGTEGAISIEGTIASLFGSILMTIVMCTLSLISFREHAFFVCFSGFIATIIESYLGVFVQNRFTWMSNELVNSVQTSIGATLAICFLNYL